MLTGVPTHTTLPVEDPARAKAFYSEKLGLEPVSEAQGGNFYEAGGARFLLYPTAGRPSGSTTSACRETSRGGDSRSATPSRTTSLAEAG